jgi:hypothetical protein
MDRALFRRFPDQFVSFFLDFGENVPKHSAETSVGIYFQNFPPKSSAAPKEIH